MTLGQLAKNLERNKSIMNYDLGVKPRSQYKRK